MLEVCASDFSSKGLEAEVGIVDTEQRLFAPERFCFRGSVDDWISIGPPEPIGKLAAKYLKHLGQESIYELL